MNRLLRFCVGLLLAGIGFTPFVSRAEWSGSFVVGPNGDFVTLAQAFDSLALCGISGEVLLEITSGIQTGPFVIPPIPGTAQYQLSITAQESAVVTLLSLDTTAPTLLVAGPHNVAVSGLTILAPAATQPALRVADSTNNLKLSSCTLYGSGTGRIVELIGPDLRGITVDNCQIRRGGDGVYLNGLTASAVGATVINTLVDSVQRGVNISYQTDCRIAFCDIRPNSSSGSGATAVLIGTQNPDDSVFVVGNRLHQIRTGSGYAVALRHNPLVATARLFAANNFIYDFQNTGSSQVRAFYFSGGLNRIVNNSARVNDVAATGTAYTVYNGLTSPESRLTLLNNILANLEGTRPSYNLFVLTPAAPLESDHNLYHGTGASYVLGWSGSAYGTLAQWQSGTGQDTKSVTGDPLFVSATDLHLQSTSEWPHQRGAVVLDTPFDFDQSSRFQPPDIGADEYSFAAPPYDAAILSVHGLLPAVPERTLLRAEVVVQNRGALPLLDLPLRLSYDDTVRAEVLVTLPPSQADTVLVVWSTAAARAQAPLRFETGLPADAHPLDNYSDFTLTITGQPLIGVYRVGNGGDYSTLAAVGADLSARGLGGAVVLELATGLYAEPLMLSAIPGLSAQNTLTIRPDPFADGLVVIAPPAEIHAVHLADVSFVTLENLVVQSNSNSAETVWLANSSDNILRGCRITGSSVAQTATAAIHASSGCSRNLFEQLDLSSAYHGLRLEGASTAADSGNVVRGCTIATTRTAVLAQWQRDLRIEQCQIEPGYPGAPSPNYGIRIGALQAGDTVHVLANRLLDAHSQGTMSLISCEAASGTMLAVNNWLGNPDAALTGELTALSVTSGTALIAHNSISIGSTSSGSVTTLSVNGQQSNVMFANNCVQISDPLAQARFITWTSGSLAANHNLFDSPGTNPQFRFAHRALDEDYQTLNSWISATGLDSQSVAAPAGFIAAHDLHIRPDAFGPSNRGAALSYVATDFDAETRATEPDIGADEYNFTASVLDLAIESIEISAMPLPANDLQTLQSTVCNVGLVDVAGAQVVLYYNEVPGDSQTLNLAGGAVTDLIWQWPTPPVDLAFGTLRVEVFAAGDVVAQNNTLSQTVVIAGTPLADSVVVGFAGGDLFSLTDLSDHLRWRGLSGPLRVLLADPFYSDPLEISGVPGLDSTTGLVIEPLTNQPVTISAVNAPSVVALTAANYVTLRNLEIIAGLGTAVGVALNAESCRNNIIGCRVLGHGSADLNTSGIVISGSTCHGNLVDSCTVSASYVGIGLTGTDSTIAEQNSVSRNTVSDTYFGIWVDHQRQALVTDNDVQPGSSTGPAGACYGVYVLQLGAHGSVRIERNRLHGFLDSSGPRTNRAAGVYSAPGVGASVEIVNNFIYGFGALTTLRSRAIYLSSGTHLVAHNSIRLDDTPADNETAGIFVSTGTQHELYNNCVLCYENDVMAHGLDIEAGAEVLSDYNCLWGNSANFHVAGLGTSHYATLAAWQATGQDAQSLSAHPLYRSATDLHIQATDPTLYQTGVLLSESPADIDGDARTSPPCIGADEYLYQAQLAAPTGLTLLVDGATATLVWQPVSGANGYRIRGGATLDELHNTPLDLGSTQQTQWIMEITDMPASLYYFDVCAE